MRISTIFHCVFLFVEQRIPDSNVYGANMGPTWVLSAPDGAHDGPMNLAIRDITKSQKYIITLTQLVMRSWDILPTEIT